jgi:uncharacterized protein YigE (DUF2233 family)
VKRTKNHILTFVLGLFITGLFCFCQSAYKTDDRFVSYIVDPKKQDIQLYWKNDQQEIFKSIARLKNWLSKKNRKLVFAMNAGMYKPDHSPQGLYIEDQQLITPLDTASGSGNFYLKPNGVFYITVDNIAAVCTTEAFPANEKIKYATQSGPMLVTDGKIHPAFIKGSNNLNIRNGVGILQGNRIIMAMSNKEINLYDFAAFFKSMGCQNALYLDGLVSRTYLPEQNWMQTDGNFGVIIGVTTDTRP